MNVTNLFIQHPLTDFNVLTWLPRILFGVLVRGVVTGILIWRILVALKRPTNGIGPNANKTRTNQKLRAAEKNKSKAKRAA